MLIVFLVVKGEIPYEGGIIDLNYRLSHPKAGGLSV